MFAPGLVALAGYQRSWLPKDIAAGLSVAAIALPVGIAYADLAGVPPHWARHFVPLSTNEEKLVGFGIDP